MRDFLFDAEQWIPKPRNEVFAFFSDPRNLERITPPWLRFRIVGQSTEHVEPGTELEYRLRLRGVPLTWVSRITEWIPGERFVDVQVRGPYAKWHHAHTFEDRDGGILIRDHVTYRLPFAPLSDWIVGRFVASDVRKIFAHRRSVTESIFQSQGPLG